MASATAEQTSTGQAFKAEPSLRANFQWTFAGNVLYAACQWGMLSVLAKAGSPAIVGQLALGLAITAPVFMFTSLNLRAVQATDARSEFAFADYFTLRVLASLTGLGAVGGVAWFLHYDRATRLVVLLVGVSKFVESLSDVCAGLLQKHERLDQVAISLTIRGGLSLAAFALTFLYTHSLVAAVTSLVLAWFAVWLFYDVAYAVARLGRHERFFRFKPPALRKLFLVSVPLGVVMTMLSLNANIPRYFLAKYRGEGDLGIFAAVAYTLTAVNLISYALSQSAAARQARTFATGDLAGFRAILNKLLAIAGGMLVLGPAAVALVGRTFLRLAYGPEYAQHVSLLVLMAVTAGVAALGFFMMCGMTAARAFRFQAPIKALATLATTALCFLLVPRMGLMGAALALLLSEIIFLISIYIGLNGAIKGLR